MAAGEHRTLREGVIAGVLGATAVAIWFLILDTVAGRPFHTPLMLGSAMATFFGSPGTGSAIPLVLGYTLVHYAAFVVVGLIVSAVVNGAEGEPSLLIGFAILFVAFEVAWYGWAAILSRSDRFGNLVNGASVTFATIGSTGTPAGSGTVTSGANGVALIPVGSWTLGQLVGTYSLGVFISGSTTGVTFTAAATQGLPVGIQIASGNPQSATVGTSRPDPMLISAAATWALAGVDPRRHTPAMTNIPVRARRRLALTCKLLRRLETA